MYKIARCRKDDIPALNNLVNEAYRGPLTAGGWTSEAGLVQGLRVDEAYLQNLLEQPGRIIIKCQIENQLAGCVLLEKMGFSCYLGMLSVKPELQAEGIGKLLLDVSDEVAATMGCTKLVITVISQRVELVEWYKRRGFSATGERQPFPVEETPFGKPMQFLEFITMEKKTSGAV